MISMCNKPRNPHRKPKPSACEVSNSKVSEASLSWSLSIQSLNSSKSSVTTGKIPANTIGLTSSKPLMAGAGFAALMMVSPTFTSLAFLIPVIKYPTSPHCTDFCSCMVSLRIPTSSAPYSRSVETNLIFSPLFMLPFKIR